MISELFFESVKGMYYFLIIPSLMVFYIRYVKNFQSTTKMKIKKDTIDFCFNDKINYEEIVYKTELLRYKKDDALKIERIPEPQILLILTTFDKISIALKNNVYDEQIIIDYYGKYFLHFYSFCRLFILQRRKSSRNPELFIEYEKLVRRWEEYSDFYHERSNFER